MRTVLVAWVGRNDLRAPAEHATNGVGPIAQALTQRTFDNAVLLYNDEEQATQRYLKWIKGQSKTHIELVHEKLSSPTQFGEIYPAAVRAIERALGTRRHDTALTLHLSPGTPAMAAVWIILGKTRFPAELIESSREGGVKTASVPFDLSAEFLPDLLREPDERLKATSAESPPKAPEFSAIIHKSQVMVRLIERARRVAVRSVPVLIEGESGTGKELLASAIHHASPRRAGPFIAVNCGAIPESLVDAELFGHKKGAFTGATHDRKGHFEMASGGTLFLDELGELPAPVQVKLLRVIQEGEIVPVGDSRPKPVDVRIVAATNRTLTEEIAANRFREDLFYRLAVAVLKLPALRHRHGDLGLLIDHLLQGVNAEGSKSEPGFIEKQLSVSARNVLLSHSWPGNVRELLNTLRRLTIWSDGPTLTAEDAREALLPLPITSPHEILGRPLGEGLDLHALLGEVARHYLRRAMDEAHGNKTKAAELVGLPSYQTLTNWLERYKIS